MVIFSGTRIPTDGVLIHPGGGLEAATGSEYGGYIDESMITG